MTVVQAELYAAFLEAGVSKEKASAAAAAVLGEGSLATKQQIAASEARLVKWGMALAALAVAAESLLDWIIR